MPSLKNAIHSAPDHTARLMLLGNLRDLLATVKGREEDEDGAFLTVDIAEETVRRRMREERIRRSVDRKGARIPQKGVPQPEGEDSLGSTSNGSSGGTSPLANTNTFVIHSEGALAAMPSVPEHGQPPPERPSTSEGAMEKALGPLNSNDLLSEGPNQGKPLTEIAMERARRIIEALQADDEADMMERDEARREVIWQTPAGPLDDASPLDASLLVPKADGRKGSLVSQASEFPAPPHADQSPTRPPSRKEQKDEASELKRFREYVDAVLSSDGSWANEFITAANATYPSNSATPVTLNISNKVDEQQPIVPSRQVQTPKSTHVIVGPPAAQKADFNRWRREYTPSATNNGTASYTRLDVVSSLRWMDQLMGVSGDSETPKKGTTKVSRQPLLRPIVPEAPLLIDERSTEYAQRPLCKRSLDRPLGLFGGSVIEPTKTLKEDDDKSDSRLTAVASQSGLRGTKSSASSGSRLLGGVTIPPKRASSVIAAPPPRLCPHCHLPAMIDANTRDLLAPTVAHTELASSNRGISTSQIEEAKLEHVKRERKERRRAATHREGGGRPLSSDSSTSSGSASQGDEEDKVAAAKAFLDSVDGEDAEPTTDLTPQRGRRRPVPTDWALKAQYSAKVDADLVRYTNRDRSLYNASALVTSIGGGVESMIPSEIPRNLLKTLDAAMWSLVGINLKRRALGTAPLTPLYMDNRVVRQAKRLATAEGRQDNTGSSSSLLTVSSCQQSASPRPAKGRDSEVSGAHRKGITFVSGDAVESNATSPAATTIVPPSIPSYPQFDRGVGINKITSRIKQVELLLKRIEMGLAAAEGDGREGYARVASTVLGNAKSKRRDTDLEALFADIPVVEVKSLPEPTNPSGGFTRNGQHRLNAPNSAANAATAPSLFAAVLAVGQLAPSELSQISPQYHLVVSQPQVMAAVFGSSGGHDYYGGMGDTDQSQPAPSVPQSQGIRSRVDEDADDDLIDQQERGGGIGASSAARRGAGSEKATAQRHHSRRKGGGAGFALDTTDVLDSNVLKAFFQQALKRPEWRTALTNLETSHRRIQLIHESNYTKLWKKHQQVSNELRAFKTQYAALERMAETIITSDQLTEMLDLEEVVANTEKQLSAVDVKLLDQDLRYKALCRETARIEWIMKQYKQAKAGLVEVARTLREGLEREADHWSVAPKSSAAWGSEVSADDRYLLSHKDKVIKDALVLIEERAATNLLEPYSNEELLTRAKRLGSLMADENDTTKSTYSSDDPPGYQVKELNKLARLPYSDNEIEEDEDSGVRRDGLDMAGQLRMDAALGKKIEFLGWVHGSDTQAIVEAKSNAAVGLNNQKLKKLAELEEQKARSRHANSVATIIASAQAETKAANEMSDQATVHNSLTTNDEAVVAEVFGGVCEACDQLVGYSRFCPQTGERHRNVTWGGSKSAFGDFGRDLGATSVDNKGLSPAPSSIAPRDTEASLASPLMKAASKLFTDLDAFGERPTANISVGYLDPQTPADKSDGPLYPLFHQHFAALQCGEALLDADKLGKIRATSTAPSSTPKPLQLTALLTPADTMLNLREKPRPSPQPSVLKAKPPTKAKQEADRLVSIRTSVVSAPDVTQPIAGRRASYSSDAGSNSGQLASEVYTFVIESPKAPAEGNPNEEQNGPISVTLPTNQLVPESPEPSANTNRSKKSPGAKKVSTISFKETEEHAALIQEEEEEEPPVIQPPEVEVTQKKHHQRQKKVPKISPPVQRTKVPTTAARPLPSHQRKPVPAQPSYAPSAAKALFAKSPTKSPPPANLDVDTFEEVQAPDGSGLTIFPSQSASPSSPRVDPNAALLAALEARLVEREQRRTILKVALFPNINAIDKESGILSGANLNSTYSPPTTNAGLSATFTSLPKKKLASASAAALAELEAGGQRSIPTNFSRFTGDRDAHNFAMMITNELGEIMRNPLKSGHPPGYSKLIDRYNKTMRRCTKAQMAKAAALAAVVNSGGVAAASAAPTAGQSLGGHEAAALVINIGLDTTATSARKMFRGLYVPTEATYEQLCVEAISEEAHLVAKEMKRYYSHIASMDARRRRARNRQLALERAGEASIPGGASPRQHSPRGDMTAEILNSQASIFSPKRAASVFAIANQHLVNRRINMPNFGSPPEPSGLNNDSFAAPPASSRGVSIDMNAAGHSLSEDLGRSSSRALSITKSQTMAPAPVFAPTGRSGFEGLSREQQRTVSALQEQLRLERQIKSYSEVLTLARYPVKVLLSKAMDLEKQHEDLQDKLMAAVDALEKETERAMASAPSPDSLPPTLRTIGNAVVAFLRNGGRNSLFSAAARPSISSQASNVASHSPQDQIRLKRTLSGIVVLPISASVTAPTEATLRRVNSGAVARRQSMAATKVNAERPEDGVDVDSDPSSVPDQRVARRPSIRFVRGESNVPPEQTSTNNLIKPKASTDSQEARKGNVKLAPKEAAEAMGVVHGQGGMLITTRGPFNSQAVPDDVESHPLGFHPGPIYSIVTSPLESTMPIREVDEVSDGSLYRSVITSIPSQPVSAMPSFRNPPTSKQLSTGDLLPRVATKTYQSGEAATARAPVEPPGPFLPTIPSVLTGRQPARAREPPTTSNPSPRQPGPTLFSFEGGLGAPKGRR